MYKNCDILVFDDIGVSDVSEWFINQVLFDILDTRYNKKKLTYFTSNFNFSELSKKLQSVSKLSSIDIGRLVDRIKALTNNTEIHIIEKNHRYD
jgi:primosomal protein DnaI